MAGVGIGTCAFEDGAEGWGGEEGEGEQCSAERGGERGVLHCCEFSAAG